MSKVVLYLSIDEVNCYVAKRLAKQAGLDVQLITSARSLAGLLKNMNGEVRGVIVEVNRSFLTENVDELCDVVLQAAARGKTCVVHGLGIPAAKKAQLKTLGIRSRRFLDRTCFLECDRRS
ncbi:MAG TPA: hypothetical protein DD670_11410 [Planctomycetaceae bacterium]|nr:hypothetical protein [Planctomycetaceae bacterium]